MKVKQSHKKMTTAQYVQYMVEQIQRTCSINQRLCMICREFVKEGDGMRSLLLFQLVPVDRRSRLGWETSEGGAEIKIYKAFSGSRGSCVRSVKCPWVMSLESPSVGSEDYKNERSPLQSAAPVEHWPRLWPGTFERNWNTPSEPGHITHHQVATSRMLWCVFGAKSLQQVQHGDRNQKRLSEQHIIVSWGHLTSVMWHVFRCEIKYLILFGLQFTASSSAEPMTHRSTDWHSSNREHLIFLFWISDEWKHLFF